MFRHLDGFREGLADDLSDAFGEICRLKRILGIEINAHGPQRICLNGFDCGCEVVVPEFQSFTEGMRTYAGELNICTSWRFLTSILLILPTRMA